MRQQIFMSLTSFVRNNAVHLQLYCRGTIMKPQIKKDDRIEFRIAPEEKKLFQRAQQLSGDKTFSGFVTRIVRARSIQIIEEKERILASERDKEIFFKAVFEGSKPNKVLSEAAKKFKRIKE